MESSLANFLEPSGKPPLFGGYTPTLHGTNPKLFKHVVGGLPGDLLDALLAAKLSGYVRGGGMFPGAFSGSQNYYDQHLASQYAAAQNAAMRGSLANDAERLSTILGNMSKKSSENKPMRPLQVLAGLAKQAGDITRYAPKWSERDHLLAALPQHLLDTQKAIESNENVDKEMTDLALIARAWMKSQRQKELLAARLKKFKQTAAYPSLAAPVKTAGAKGEQIKDLLPGGAADGMRDVEFNKKELHKGMLEEREHTSNNRIAKEIAKDHLVESPKYYSQLEKNEMAQNYKSAESALEKLLGKQARCWKGYEPVPGKEPYSEDSCRPKGSVKKKKQVKKANDVALLRNLLIKWASPELKKDVAVMDNASPEEAQKAYVAPRSRFSEMADNAAGGYVQFRKDHPNLEFAASHIPFAGPVVDVLGAAAEHGEGNTGAAIGNLASSAAGAVLPFGIGKAVGYGGKGVIKTLANRGFKEGMREAGIKGLIHTNAEIASKGPAYLGKAVDYKKQNQIEHANNQLLQQAPQREYEAQQQRFQQAQAVKNQPGYSLGSATSAAANSIKPPGPVPTPSAPQPQIAKPVSAPTPPQPPAQHKSTQPMIAGKPPQLGLNKQGHYPQDTGTLLFIRNCFFGRNSGSSLKIAP